MAGSIDELVSGVVALAAAAGVGEEDVVGDHLLGLRGHRLGGLEDGARVVIEDGPLRRATHRAALRDRERGGRARRGHVATRRRGPDDGFEPGTRFGYSTFGYTRAGERREVYSSGGLVGGRASLYVLPDDGLVLALMTNLTDPDIVPFERELLGILLPGYVPWEPPAESR